MALEQRRNKSSTRFVHLSFWILNSSSRKFLTGRSEKYSQHNACTWTVSQLIANWIAEKSNFAYFRAFFFIQSFLSASFLFTVFVSFFFYGKSKRLLFAVPVHSQTRSRLNNVVSGQFFSLKVCCYWYCCMLRIDFWVCRRWLDSIQFLTTSNRYVYLGGWDTR